MLTALLAFILCFFDTFVAAPQELRQGALWQKPVCWSLPPGSATSPPEILGDPLTNNTYVEHPSARGSGELLTCLLASRGYLSMPEFSGGLGHNFCSGEFQSESCLGNALSNPIFTPAAYELQKKNWLLLELNVCTHPGLGQERILKSPSFCIQQICLSLQYVFGYLMGLLKSMD